MRIMGVDYGDARTGIAMSDLLCSIVGTTTVIHSRRDEKTIAEIQKLIAQNGITEIVVGLPKNMNGTEGPRADGCKEFAQKLAQLFGLEEGEGEKILLHRDSSDYVMHVEVAGKRITGEEFREAFGLASACFSLQQQENNILITTRGVGHGFGFCQYHANRLAAGGQTYTQLLETFFVGLKTEKI